MWDDVCKKKMSFNESIIIPKFILNLLSVSVNHPETKVVDIIGETKSVGACIEIYTCIEM